MADTPQKTIGRLAYPDGFAPERTRPDFTAEALRLASSLKAGISWTEAIEEALGQAYGRGRTAGSPFCRECRNQDRRRKETR